MAKSDTELLVAWTRAGTLLLSALSRALSLLAQAEKHAKGARKAQLLRELAQEAKGALDQAERLVGNPVSPARPITGVDATPNSR